MDGRLRSRPAGSSARRRYGEELRRVRRRRIRALAFAVVLGAVAAVGSSGHPHRAAVVVVATGVALGVLWWSWPRRDPERWWRGAAGEEATEALLDRLPGSRWTILHDLALPGTRANVDHLVIGPTGVWVVDSKATRGAVTSGWGWVRLGRHALDVSATRWEAQVVADRLGCDVRALVVVHSTGPVGLSRRGRRVAGVRVVPAGGLLRLLRRRRWRRAAVAGDLAGRLERLVAAG